MEVAKSQWTVSSWADQLLRNWPRHNALKALNQDQRHEEFEQCLNIYEHFPLACEKYF